MPIIGRIFGGLDFTNYFIGLTPAASQAATYDAAKKAGATLGYGTFITVTVNFIIIAWVLFLVIKGMNRVFKQEEAAPAAARAADAGGGAADRDPRSPEGARARRSRGPPHGLDERTSPRRWPAPARRKSS